MNKTGIFGSGGRRMALGEIVIGAGNRLRGWWTKRLNAKAVADLSPEQIRDCEIELTGPNKPTVVVPTEIRQMLLSMH